MSEKWDYQSLAAPFWPYHIAILRSLSPKLKPAAGFNPLNGARPFASAAPITSATRRLLVFPIQSLIAQSGLVFLLDEMFDF
jgi:hypothetical protein